MTDPSFDEFVVASLPTLNRYAYALTGRVPASEDLVQDTLVKLAGAWQRVHRDGNPLGYARTVMFRLHVSWWRVRGRRPVDTAYQELPAPDDEYAAVDAWDQLRRMLIRLPALQRAVIVLSILDDLPDDEIAVLLDRAPATIRSLRHRGLRTMRKSLRHDDDHDKLMEECDARR